MKNDTQLLKASMRGNRRAFAAIVERYQSLVCSVTYGLTGDFGVSEDLAQETFLAAWSNLGSVRDPSRLGAWLCGIARNVSLGWLRRRQRDVLAQAGPVENAAPRAAAGPTPCQAAVGEEEQALVWRALEQIPEDYRIPLVLYYREGKSVKAVAATMDLSVDAVKQRLHRGRAMLKDRMARVVESSLARTKPGKDFTSGVLAALPGVVGGGGVSSGLVSNGIVVKAVAMGIPLLLLGLIAISWSSGTPADVTGAAVAVEQNAEVSHGSNISAADPMSRPMAEAEPALAPIAPPTSRVETALAPREVARPGYPGCPCPESQRSTVTGVVQDPKGRALEGAKVWIARFGMNARDTRETRSDGDGRFSVSVPPGQWFLQARRGTLGGEADTGFAGQLVTEEGGKQYDAIIRMAPCCRVHGRIRDARTGSPIPHGKLWTSSRVLVTADEEGRYEIEGQRHAYQTLIALCPGYERKYVIYTPIVGDEFGLDLSLERAGKVCGQVTDPEGRPLAHAWVCRPMSGHGAMSANYEVCDENGCFEFDGLPLGQSVCFEARLPYYENTCGSPLNDLEGGGRARRTVLVPDDGGLGEPLVFVLNPAFSEEVYSPTPAGTVRSRARSQDGSSGPMAGPWSTSAY